MAARSASVRSDLQPAVIKAVEGLSRISLEAGITMSQLAIAYVMRSSKVVSAIVGVRSVEQLEEMFGACAHDLSGEFWAGVDEYLRNLVGLEHVSLGKPVLPQ